MVNPIATRIEGERRLAAFAPRMGRQYANGRNTDHGPGAHQAVSQFSPYIRRRLLLEADAVATAIAAHGPEAAEKFIHEVVWRGYFKGWLERRRGIWASYRHSLAQDLATIEVDRELAQAVNRAEAGETGLACFDAWARELVDTGYLHNHARMWFASIWIFTLELPWRVGADFFYRHLLDGDPASNTLGWRWVAGLHTRGKTYQAQSWNIAKFSAGRFTPSGTDLAANAPSIDHTEPEGLPPAAPLRTPQTFDPALPAALLITEEDCRPEDFSLATLDIRAAATLSASHLRSPRQVAPMVNEFETVALADAASRSGLDCEKMHAGADCDLAAWAERVGIKQIVTPYIPEGPLRDWLRLVEPKLATQGIAFCEWRRDWDAAIWPHSTAGFFKVKERIPRILQDLRMT